MIRTPRAVGLRRRDLLIGASLAAVGLAPFTAGCMPKPAPEPPDPLAALATRASTDAALAKATSTAHPNLAEVASLVADNRAQHAATMLTEVRRLHPATTTTPPRSSAPPPPPAVAPDEKAALTSMIDAARQAHREAAALVPGLPRYRAGMVGSVAAGCAALGEVLAS